jgi:DNA-binding NtrC family response regulator
VLDLRRRIRSLAGATVPVLIDGESGTGKEIVARNLHRLGGRSQKPLVIVNCMELPETLLQSELFGHLKGAVTGAVKDRMGLVESANGGTLFLDEIGEMPLTQQAALLRVLQEHEVRRIGDSARRTVDVRFVFATNRDLAECVRRGRFREDLYFRVSAVRLSLPPLRRRREDIPMLVGHFLEQHAASGGSITGVSPAALCRMLSYAWPGNVRELRNEIERAVALNRDARIITLDMLSPAVREAAPAVGTGGVAAHETLRTAVEGVERRMISEALECSEGNRTRAAAVLGVSRQGLLKKMRRYGMR